jgi:hypothetical protein
MPIDPIWCIMPVVNNWEMTQQAVYDLLGQSVPTRLLIVAQGVDEALRESLERLSERHAERVLCWFWDPKMPSLSGLWNRALQFVWACGGTEALVVNNDVRLRLATLETLHECLERAGALFVSAVGVTAEDYAKGDDQRAPYYDGLLAARGGPDFSCFLISKACHEKYRFDENHIPAFAEDLTYHREMMLGGDGPRIFSVNLPYLHYASQSLKAMTPEERERTEHQINSISRAYFERVWGGPVNHERYAIKGDPTSARSGVTTPELQALVQAGVPTVGGLVDDVSYIATLDSEASS